MHKREDYLLTKRNITMRMDPCIAKIFSESQNVSGMIPVVIWFLVEKGKSHRLLRKALIKDEKEAKNVRQQRLERDADKIPALKIEIENLRSEIAAKNAEREEE